MSDLPTIPHSSDLAALRRLGLVLDMDHETPNPWPIRYGALQEADYKEALHPRGRGGRWIPKFKPVTSPLTRPKLTQDSVKSLKDQFDAIEDHGTIAGIGVVRQENEGEGGDPWADEGSTTWVITDGDYGWDGEDPDMALDIIQRILRNRELERTHKARRAALREKRKTILGEGWQAAVEHRNKQREQATVGSLGVRITADVAALKSPEEASKWLFDNYAIEADFDSPRMRQALRDHGTNEFNVQRYIHEITQATSDALDTHPVLMTGPQALYNIRQMGTTVGRAQAEANEAIDTFMDQGWAVTGPDLAGNAERDIIPRPDADSTTVYVNDDGNSFDYQAPGQGSWPTPSIYGRMTHELGHAAIAASGLQTQRKGGPGEGVEADFPSASGAWLYDPGDGTKPYYFWTYEAKALDAAGLTQQEIYLLSKYGASDPAEAWAEMFALLNVPTALDHVDDDQRAKLLRLREIANQGEYKLL